MVIYDQIVNLSLSKKVEAEAPDEEAKSREERAKIDVASPRASVKYHRCSMSMQLGYKGLIF